MAGLLGVKDDQPSLDTGKRLERQRSFADQGAFLWTQRRHLCNSPIDGLDALQRLDDKLEAAIEGMLLRPGESRAACRELIDEAEAGAVTMAAALAVASGDGPSLERLLALAEGQQRWRAELVESLAWLPYDMVRGLFSDVLAEHPDTLLGELVVLALQHHTRSPASLDWWRLLDQPATRAATIALIGVQQPGGCGEALPNLLPAEPGWVHWSRQVCKHDGDGDVIVQAVLARRMPAQLGLPVAFASLGAEARGAWIQHLSDDPHNAALAVEAIGIDGRSDGIDQLIARYPGAATPLARKHIAHAYRRITGYYPALARSSNSPAAHDDDTEEELTELRPLDFLPSADLGRMKTWWRDNRARFDPTRRYRAGRPADTAWRDEILRSAPQSERAIVALERAALGHDRVFPVNAPAWRQLNLLNTR